jgi:hypothetical protein
MIQALLAQWRERSRGEKICLGIMLAALVAWTLMSRIAQDPAYHGFADQRSWLGIPNAANVLSNLAFLAVGFAGIVGLAAPRRPRFALATETGLWCIALGFVATAAGSAWYHLEPNNRTLVWDRLPMTVIFAGLLATALAQRISERIARAALIVLLPLGIASVLYWHITGDLSLYVAVQFGGIVALVALLALSRGRDDPFGWWWVLAAYALAKIAEAGDHVIWSATGGFVAGHTLKHLLAAVAGLVVLVPLFDKDSTLRQAMPASRA